MLFNCSSIWADQCTSWCSNPGVNSCYLTLMTDQSMQMLDGTLSLLLNMKQQAHLRLS